MMLGGVEAKSITTTFLKHSNCNELFAPELHGVVFLDSNVMGSNF